MKRALPGGLTVVLGIGALLVLQNVFSIPQERLSVMAVFNTAAVCFGVLIGVCRPFRKWHTAMIAAVAAAFCAASWLFGGLFYITPLNWREWLCLAVMIPASLVILYGLRLLLGKLLSRWSGGFPAASRLKKRRPWRCCRFRRCTRFGSERFSPTTCALHPEPNRCSRANSPTAPGRACSIE